MTPDKVEAALGVLRSVANARKWWLTPWSDGGGNDSPKSALSNFTEASKGIEEAISVLTEALAERDWRPIESAPRDGSKVLAAFEGQFEWVMFIAYATPRGVSSPGFANPTHWQPLPESPHAR